MSLELTRSARSGPRTCVVAAAVLAFMCLAITAGAQETTAELYGTVKDSTGGVLPGVTLAVTSPQLIGGSRTAVTDDGGQWRVPRLPPGTYAVQASLSGFQTLTVERIAMDSGVSFAVPITLTITTVEETVTVTSDAAVIDVRSSVTTYTVDQDIISNVPMERSYADVLTTLPGVTTGSRYTYSLTQAVHGSSVRDNDYILDGQSTKHPSGYSGSEFSIEALELTQASTSGVSAEFGQASGGVFTFVTKSGGDNFAGSSYYYIVDEAIQSNNAAGLAQEQNAVVRDTNYGGNIGGPIVKQKLWFFADFNRNTNELAQANYPAPSTRSRLGSEANIHERKKLYLVKGTWAPLSNSRFSYTFNLQDRWMRPSNPGSKFRFDETAWRKQFWKPKTHSAQWSSVFGDSTIFDAQWGWLKVNEDNTFPFGSYDASNVHGYEDRGSGVAYGTWNQLRGRFDGRDHWDVRTALTHFKKSSAGDHDFKFGFHHQKSWSQRWRVIPDGFRQYLDSASDCFSLDCAVPDQIRIYQQPTDTQDAHRVMAVYAQDSWSLGDVTLNLGLRFEHSNGWTPEQRGGCDLVPNGFSPDYDGNTVDFPRKCYFPNFTWPERPNIINWNTIAPRFGFNWDVTGEGKVIVKGSAGRWHDKVGGAGSGNPNSSKLTRFDWLDCRDAAGNPISCQGLPADQMNGDLHFVAGEEGRLISNSVKSPEEFAGTITHDPNLLQPYVDSVNLGFEFGVGADFSLSVTGMYKRAGDLYATTDPLRPHDQAYDEVSVINPVNNQPMNIFVVNPAFTDSGSLRSNSDLAERHYKGLEFVARRRFRDDWQLLGSYTLGSSTGNLGTHFNDSFSLNVRSPNDLINRDGPLSLDSRHLLKLSFSWIAPYDINIGAQYLGQTGFPANTLLGRSRMPGATFFQFQRGIHYPTNNPDGIKYRESRVDVAVEPRGTHRVDFQNILNLRVEKTLDLNGGKRIGLTFDVMNILNSGAVTHVQEQRFGLENFLETEAIVFPRRARIGVKFQF